MRKVRFLQNHSEWFDIDIKRFDPRLTLGERVNSYIRE